MKCTLPFEAFCGELYDQWRRDRALRQRIPLDESWHGCIGLAALFDDPDDCECCADKVLYPNDRVSWLCLRDLPGGHFPGSASMNRREVNYVTRTRAKVRHGMPVLDFADPEAARGAWDFRFDPFPEHRRRVSPHREVLVRPVGDILDPVAHRREFRVLNHLSEAMTRFAFLATDPSGRPFRASWARRRPGRLGDPFRPRPAGHAMPRPYLSFPSHLGDSLYAMATEATSLSAAVQCPSCQRRYALERFRDRRCGTEMFEDGDFLAHCPGCMRRRKWHLADAVPGRVRRRFPLPFREQFCDAVAQGLPVASVGPGDLSRSGAATETGRGSADVRPWARSRGPPIPQPCRWCETAGVPATGRQAAL
jgi:hypothetical protein